MNQALRIAVAEDEPELLEDLRESLVGLGHEVVATARNGQELLKRCRETRPDLVVTDIKMPDMDGLEAAEQLGRERPVPIVIVSAYHDDEFIERALESCVLAYLVKPIEDGSLAASVSLAMWRFRELQALQQETTNLRQALRDRKTVERAKGILMKRAQLDEDDAFRRLQDLASTNNRKMVDIARSIVLAEEAFRTPR